MTEITETVTVSFERFTDMMEREQGLKDEINAFENLFTLKVIDGEIFAVVKQTELEIWATRNLYKGTSFINRKFVEKLIIETEDSQ